MKRGSERLSGVLTAGFILAAMLMCSGCEFERLNDCDPDRRDPPPAVVPRLVSTSSGLPPQTVSLSWEPVESNGCGGAVVYHVGRRAHRTLAREPISPSTGLDGCSFVDEPSQEDSEEWFYSVCVEDACMAVSEWSKDLRVTMVDKVDLGAPGAVVLSIVWGDPTTLVWSQSLAGDFCHYRLFEGAVLELLEAGEGLAIYSVADTTHLVDWTPSGTDTVRFYAVRVRDRFGNVSDLSNPVSVTE